MSSVFAQKVRAGAVASLTALAVGVGGAAVVQAQPAPPALPGPPSAPAPGGPAPAPGGPALPPPPAVQSAIPQLPAVPGMQNAPGHPKELVAFGDSFSANAGRNAPRNLQPSPLPWTANCVTDMENWPKIVGREQNKSVGDWSCNGTGGMPVVQLMAYVESSIIHGDLGPGTKDVVLMYGGMDTFQWVDVAGTLQGSLNPEAQTPFRQTVEWVRDRVAQAAPGARVHLASYPEFASGDQICLANMPGKTFPIPAPGGAQVQGALRDNIRGAAEHAGIGFIDVYQGSIGHGTCAPDAERWTAGMADPQIGPMPNHPTIQGEYGMAGIIGHELYHA